MAFESARTDADPLTKDELLEQVAATQRVANSALATQAVRIAQAASHEEIFDPEIADTRMIRRTTSGSPPSGSTPRSRRCSASVRGR